MMKSSSGSADRRHRRNVRESHGSKPFSAWALQLNRPANKGVCRFQHSAETNPYVALGPQSGKVHGNVLAFPNPADLDRARLSTSAFYDEIAALRLRDHDREQTLIDRFT